MAEAVSTWSPVIMMGRMPAVRQFTMASRTSGRTGSIIPQRPMKHRSFSSASGVETMGLPSQSRLAQASTRRARSAISLLAFRIRSRTWSVMGTALPSFQ